MTRLEAMNGAFRRRFLVCRKLFFGEIKVARKYHSNGFLATTDTVFALCGVQSSMSHVSPHSCGKIVLVCRSAGVCRHCGGFGGEGVCLPSVGG